MPDDRPDDAMRDLHRSASAVQDERPADRVRATVLAAAASHAAARAAPGPFRTRRASLAIAATLLVSVAAGLLVAHVARDDPRSVRPVASVAMVAQDAPTDAREEATHDTQDRSPTPQQATDADRLLRARPHQAPRVNSSVPASPARDRAAVGVTPRRAPGSRSIETPPEPFPRLAAAPVAAPAIPAPPQATAAATPAADDPRSDAASSRVAAQADVARREAAPTGDSRASLASSLALRRAAAPDESLEAWIARIVALRQAGNDIEADRELAALRRRHPDVVVPPTALRATGTR